MINANMREYNYFTLEKNEYGQDVIPQDAQPEGKIKMAITISNQSVQNNILFQGATYTGLTHDTEVNDAYIIDFDGERLKVLYVSPKSRLRQVFLTKAV